MFVTHATTTAEILEQTDLVLRQGLADIVELRMKDAPWETFLHTATRSLSALSCLQRPPYSSMTE